MSAESTTNILDYVQNQAMGIIENFITAIREAFENFVSTIRDIIASIFGVADEEGEE